MTTRTFDPTTENYRKNKAPSGDRIDDFFKNFLDFTANRVRVDANVSVGSVTIDLDASTDNVEIKGRDGANDLKTIRTDIDGKVVTLTSGSKDLEIQHFVNESADDTPVTESLANAVAIVIFNTSAIELLLSFDGGTTWFPVPSQRSFSYEANNTSIQIKSSTTVTVTFKGLKTVMV